MTKDEKIQHLWCEIKRKEGRKRHDQMECKYDEIFYFMIINTVLQISRMCRTLCLSLSLPLSLSASLFPYLFSALSPSFPTSLYLPFPSPYLFYTFSTVSSYLYDQFILQFLFGGFNFNTPKGHFSPQLIQLGVKLLSKKKINIKILKK